MEEKSNYRGCFVPLCPSTQKLFPNKIFVSLPKDIKERVIWFRKARRKDDPTNSNFYCCEDHFNVSIQNYVSFLHFSSKMVIYANLM